MEEKYTLEQIVDAIVQDYEAIKYAIQCRDREMLEELLEENLCQ